MYQYGIKLTSEIQHICKGNKRICHKDFSTCKAQTKFLKKYSYLYPFVSLFISASLFHDSKQIYNMTLNIMPQNKYK